MLDVSTYTGHISVGACYDPDTGTTLAVEIYEADQRIRVDRDVLSTILRTGSPWACLSGRLLRLTDSDDRVVIYMLDGIDKVSGDFYFSWPD